MQFLLFLFLFENPGTVITLEDPFFLAEDLAIHGQYFYVLDRRSYAVGKFAKDGTRLSHIKGRGQGPGEFNKPRSIAVNERFVFVSDYRMIHIFDHDLKFLKRFETINNPRDMVTFGDKLFVSTVEFPGGSESIYVYRGDGHFVEKFHEHNSPDAQMVMPFLDIDSFGSLYVQPRIGYGAHRLSENGQSLDLPALKRSGRYKDFVPFQPFVKKYGSSLATVKKWKIEWSEPEGIAVVQDRYLVLSFMNLEKDLVTIKHYLEGFDLQSGQKVLNWVEAPGKLLHGGDGLYFFIDADKPVINRFELESLAK